MSGAGDKTVHLKVHGQKKLLEQVKAKLVAKASKGVRCGQQVLNGQEIKEILSRWFGPLLHLRRSLLVRSRTHASESQNKGIDPGAWTSVS